MTEYGLIGKTLGHSFSAKYFNGKFAREGIEARYELFPLAEISDLNRLLDSHPDLNGLNVTIPYKVDVIPMLDSLSQEAKEIGAVNVIKISRDSDGEISELKGFNSDAYGFMESIRPFLQTSTSPAPRTSSPSVLVLGTGGASRAVDWAMRQLGYDVVKVGRTRRDGILAYEDLTPEMVQKATAVINCTPLGTYPDVNAAAPFPYQYLREGQVCFDLVYNPAETLFMRIAKAHGCVVSNGLGMLRLQAVKAWEIWQEGE